MSDEIKELLIEYGAKSDFEEEEGEHEEDTRITDITHEV